MKHFILFIYLTFITSSALRAKGIDSIAQYYDRKYAAEMAIVDSNYLHALSLYETAFKYKRPNEKDLYNAFILTCLLKDTVYGRQYFNQLVYLGLTEWGLADDLKQFRMDTLFIGRINSDYQRIHAQSLKAPLKRCAEVMDSFYNFDQGIRQYAMNTYGHVEGLRRYNDSFIVVDSINIKNMLDFIGKEGFPDIYTTGFYQANYKHISSHPMITLLLRHTLGIPSSRPDKAALMSQVKKAVIEGKYDPREYAFVYDEAEGTNKYGSLLTLSESGDRVVDETVTLEKIQQINLARKQIYLDSVEDYEKKIEFVKRCSYFHFFNIFLTMYNQAFYVPNPIKPR